MILFGSLGYYLIYAGQIRFMECLYMTVISITSVGFGEIVIIEDAMGVRITDFNVEE